MSHASLPEAQPAADRIELLRWAGQRPDVLRLLGALRKHDYDASATEHLRRIVTGDRGEDTGSRPSVMGRNGGAK